MISNAVHFRVSKVTSLLHSRQKKRIKKREIDEKPKQKHARKQAQINDASQSTTDASEQSARVRRTRISLFTTLSLPLRSSQVLLSSSEFLK